MSTASPHELTNRQGHNTTEDKHLQAPKLNGKRTRSSHSYICMWRPKQMPHSQSPAIKRTGTNHTHEQTYQQQSPFAISSSSSPLRSTRSLTLTSQAASTDMHMSCRASRKQHTWPHIVHTWLPLALAHTGTNTYSLSLMPDSTHLKDGQEMRCKAKLWQCVRNHPVTNARVQRYGKQATIQPDRYSKSPCSNEYDWNTESATFPTQSNPRPTMGCA
jgi:hypothetical protein